MNRPADLPTGSPDGLDAVLALLDALERPGFVPGRLVVEAGRLPWHDEAPELARFVAGFYRSGLLASFDWPAWQAEARRLVDDPAALAAADFDTVRRLLTLHVRADRFNAGHLGAVARSGHLAAVLRRLRALRDAGALPFDDARAADGADEGTTAG